MKQNFSEHTRKLASKLNNGYCMIPGCREKAVDFHHRFPNTIYNNKCYPLFMQSIFNLAILCRKHHDDYGSFPWLKISEQQAEIYELWLENFKEEIK